MRRAAQGEGTVHIRQTLTSPIRQAVSFPHQTDCTVPRPTGCTVLRPTDCTVLHPTDCTAPSDRLYRFPSDRLYRPHPTDCTAPVRQVISFPVRQAVPFPVRQVIPFPVRRAVLSSWPLISENSGIWKAPCLRAGPGRFLGVCQSTSSMATGTEGRERRRTPSASVSSVSVCTSPLASVTLSVTGWLW